MGDPGRQLSRHSETFVTSTYDLGTPMVGQPGIYKLCWAHQGVSGPEYQTAAGLVQIDATGELVGPVPLDFTCTMGLLCKVTLTGFGLSTSINSSQYWMAVVIPPTAPFLLSP